jgi:hypothetical protein
VDIEAPIAHNNAIVDKLGKIKEVTYKTQTDIVSFISELSV